MSVKRYRHRHIQGFARAISGDPRFDYSGKLIIPGMADIHQHAPQYGFRGLGMALDLDSNWNTWFMQYSLPEERHFNDLNYAELAYENSQMTCLDLLRPERVRLQRSIAPRQSF